MYELYQETPANVEHNANPGYGTIAFFQQLKNFTLVEEVTGGGSVEGDTKIITGNHTFPTDEGFVQYSDHQGGSTLEGEASGDEGFVGLPGYKFTIFLVGDSPALQEKVEGMRNMAGILIFKDPECDATRMHQLGCKCDPAIVTSIKFTSGGRKSGGKKGWEVTLTSTCKFDYQGTLTLKV